ncbi:MAG TPA: hypothetical protein VFG79_14525 [Solirubrobacter sp.]|nr:hypothetical protein [Solirubrobacter sp.]
MTTPEAPWAHLVALAERERDLARDGRWEEAATASTERLEAALALGTPPAAARVHLERLLAVQQQITASLTAGRAMTVRRLGELNRGRTAIRGYGAGLGAVAPSIDGRA